jgi:hypothetical protein
MTYRFQRKGKCNYLLWGNREADAGTTYIKRRTIFTAIVILFIASISFFLPGLVRMAFTALKGAARYRS